MEFGIRLLENIVLKTDHSSIVLERGKLEVEESHVSFPTLKFPFGTDQRCKGV
jgi:hypothetical protein